MNLILWRHAEADKGVPDSARRLTLQGQRQARKIARWLAKRLPEGTIVIASPARRAQETAAALVRRFETHAALAMSSEARAILEAAGWPGESGRTVVLVGHQPLLGSAALLALSGRPGALELAPAALVWLESRSGASEEGVLRAAIGPDLA